MNIKKHQKENHAKYWKGKHRTKKFKKQISDKFKDAKYMNDGYNQYLLKPEYWGEFIDIGYRFGRM